MTSNPTPLDAEPPFPNAARIYDYILGGSLNHEADRQAAEYMFSLLPSTQKWVRMLRVFLQKAARDLHTEGFDQFLDLGAGLPTPDHIHHAAPTATVVYVDSDPVTVQEGQRLLAGVPTAHYMGGNALEIEAILDSPTVRQAIDRSRKVAIGLSGMLVFFTPEQVEPLARTLYNWAPPGSKVYCTFETKDMSRTTPAWEQFLGVFEASGSPYYIFSLQENIEMLRPWQPALVQPLAEYLGYSADYITEADREGLDLEFYAALLAK